MIIRIPALRLTPLILAVALFMEQMDSTVIATALPAIASDIGSDPIALKLALTSYFVALAIFIPASGWIADRFGAVNVFRAAIAVFMLGSLACSLSYSLGSFVSARFLQGIGAAMMSPVGRMLLVRGTPKAELVNAMAWLTIPALMGPVTGPLIGGFLTTYLSWHWIFWINIPVGLIGIVLATKYLQIPEVEAPGRLDFIGFLLSGLACAGLVLGLSIASLPALPPVLGVAMVAVGLVSGALFVRRSLRRPVPLLDLRLLSRPMFRDATIAGFVFRIGLGAMPFLLPLMLQLGFGLTPFQSGAITFVSALGAVVTKFFVARVYGRFGLPRTLGVCALIAGALTAVHGLFTPETPWAAMMAVLLAAGVMRSMFFTGNNAFAFGDIDAPEAGHASALTSVGQQLSIASGVAVAGLILESLQALTGEGLQLVHFHIAFAIVGAISAVAGLLYLRLPSDAGADLAGKAPAH